MAKTMISQYYSYYIQLTCFDDLKNSFDIFREYVNSSPLQFVIKVRKYVQFQLIGKLIKFKTNHIQPALYKELVTQFEFINKF